MSEHAKKGSKAHTSGVVVGDGKSYKLRRVRLIGEGIAGLIVIVLLVGGAIVLARHHKPHDSLGPSPEHLTTQQQIDQVVNKTVQHPDYTSAKDLLNQQLANTKDPKKQADLYFQLAAIAAQQNDNQGIIDNDLKVVQLDSSRSGPLAQNIADAYYALGQKDTALPYYKQALAYYQAQPDNFSGKTYYVNQVNAKIAELAQ